MRVLQPSRLTCPPSLPCGGWWLLLTYGRLPKITLGVLYGMVVLFCEGSVLVCLIPTVSCWPCVQYIYITHRSKSQSILHLYKMLYICVGRHILAYRMSYMYGISCHGKSWNYCSVNQISNLSHSSKLWVLKQFLGPLKIIPVPLLSMS